jgi:hypothetical protein
VDLQNNQVLTKCEIPNERKSHETGVDEK